MSDSGENGKGRRRYERLMREIPFKYETIENERGAEADQARKGLILDVSAAGVRFLAMELLAKDTELIIEFDLRNLFQEGYRQYFPDLGSYEEPVKMRGKVIWSTATAMEDEYEVGVQFLGKV
ncbi:MAG: PilZ domain-containing protein [Desulfurivibrionaceae bacterium]